MSKTKETSDKVQMRCTLMWAFLTKKREGNEKYSVNLCNLSEAAVDKLEEMGIEVKRNADKPEQGYFITCYSVNPFRPRDTSGVLIDPEILVGNGSKATVVVEPYHWQYQKKKGTSAHISTMIITDLVEYSPVGSIDESQPIL